MKMRSKSAGTLLPIILGFALISVLHCGLFEKRYPPDGEFCNVMVKPEVCIKVRFESKIVEFSPEEVYPMDSVNRVNYHFYPSPGKKVQLLVLTEHRVKLSDGTFYLRTKKKRKQP